MVHACAWGQICWRVRCRQAHTVHKRVDSPIPLSTPGIVVLVAFIVPLVAILTTMVYIHKTLRP